MKRMKEKNENKSATAFISGDEHRQSGHRSKKKIHTTQTQSQNDVENGRKTTTTTTNIPRVMLFHHHTNSVCISSATVQYGYVDIWNNSTSNSFVDVAYSIYNADTHYITWARLYRRIMCVWVSEKEKYKRNTRNDSASVMFQTMKLESNSNFCNAISYEHMSCVCIRYFSISDVFYIIYITHTHTHTQQFSCITMDSYLVLQSNFSRYSCRPFFARFSTSLLGPL